MSLDPRLGHLYNDNIASIDAREQLRMRETNAREKRYLVHHTYVLDRARDICERSRKWEHENVKRQMKKIQDRTMSLEMSLKQEARRVAGLKKGGNVVTSAPSLVSRKSVFADVQREVKSAPNTMSSALTLPRSNGLKRRNRHVVRSLLKMYNRCEERKRRSEEYSFKLDPAQIDVLQKARVVLRGTKAEGEVSRILDQNTGSNRTGADDRVSRYANLFDGDIKATSRVNGGGSDQALDEEKEREMSTSGSVMPVTWTRFNKLPELWRQQHAMPDEVESKLGTKISNHRKLRVS